MLYSLIKPILFALPPELAHEYSLTLAKLCPELGRLSGNRLNDKLSLKVGSLNWKSPIGLAAGLDKNAEALDFFSAQGFGSLECGTVTLKPQLGNPKPRLFRYPQEKSLRNSMGFPNEGLRYITPRLEAFDRSLPLGVNLGKNKDSSAEESIDELGTMMAALDDVADYFVVNVSSPNTPGLRALQEKSYLSELFGELKSMSHKDLYLKIAPDLDGTKIIELVKIAEDFKLAGLIATNTTMMPERGAGGVSGALLKEKSRAVRKIILEQQSSLELIGVGGFSNFEDLKEFWYDGGKVIQLYTAYIYGGPDLLKSMNNKILDFLRLNELADLGSLFNLPLAERKKLLV
jgi:dihydroorotate dehydrogenase